MSLVFFKTNVITSDGADLIKRAKAESDKVYITKAAFLPFTINRNEGANIHASEFIDSRFTKYYPSESNISAVVPAFPGDDDNFISVQTKGTSAQPFNVKSVVLFACLFSELETDCKEVAFATISDDNSLFECNSSGVVFSIQLNANSNMFKQFGDDAEEVVHIDDLNDYVTTETFNTTLEGYATNDSVSDLQQDVVDLQEFTVDQSGDVESGGPDITLKQTYSQDIDISSNNVPVSVSASGTDFIIITGNGDKYTLSGVTFTKTSAFQKEVIVGYFTDLGDEETENTAIGTEARENGTIKDADGDDLKPGDDNEVYTITKVENAAGETVASGTDIILNNDGAGVSLSWTTEGTDITDINVYKIYMTISIGG